MLAPIKKYHKSDMKGWRFHDILRTPDWPNPKHWQALKD
jgi:hypothetical protein